MTTRCYFIDTLDPYFNLAAEEYLLKHYQDDIFMLWKGESSIVVGKHQNALAEINHAYVEKQGLKIARRLSGGGTVFHDPGNVNFTFIRNIEQVDQLNYAMFLEDVKQVLKQLGLSVYNSERDDLMLDGFKISGNAQHVYRKRVLHHGTLLFDSNLSELKNALKVDLSRFKHKAIQSNRSEVANIRPYLKEDMPINAFIDYLYSSIANLMPQKEIATLSEKDTEQIELLRAEKYSTWDWIYGYSPKYTYQSKQNEYGTCLFLKVEKGRIKQVQFDGVGEDLNNILRHVLLECRHEIKEVKANLENTEEQLTKHGLSVNGLIKMMF